MLSTSSTTKNRLSVVEFDSLLSNTQTKRLSLGGPDLASASELEGSTDHSSSEPTESNEDLSAFQEAESAQELPSAPKDQKGQHQRSGAARKSEEGTRTRLLNTSRNWSPQRKDSRDKDPSQPRESLASSSSLKRDSFVLVDNTSSALNSPTYPNFAPPLSDDMEPDTSAGTITSSSAAAAPNPSRTSQDSSWGRTMRKTSGFFKKRFGNFSHQPASSPSNAPFYTNSNKSSPSQNSTATFRNQHHPSQTADIPPVPSIPQRLVTDPLDRRRSASVSRVPPSTSTNSVVQSGSNNRSRSTTSHSNTTASHSEDERLKNVLRSVDWDGLAEKLDEPPTPPSKDEPNSRQMMPPRTHNERSYSLPHSPSHFDAMAAASAAVSQQALGRPRSATVQSSPTRSSFAEDTPLRAAGREDDTTPPSIRLVPSRSTPGSPATKDNSLVYHASQPVPGKNEEEEDKMEEIEKEGTPTPPVSTTSRGDEHGLGLSLDPISESSTSRESLISNSTTRPPVSTTSLPDSPSDSISPTSIRASSMKRHSLVTSSPISISTTSLHRNFSIPASSNLSEEEIQQKGIELAQKCWDQDESAIKKHKIAEYLGSSDPISDVARRHYINKFDFPGLRLDNAFRKLCEKLHLKAETQQVDRILEDFSRKYWEDNSDCGLPSSDVVHQVVYSILLLNTDLHVADVASHMSSKQFIKNTMTTINQHSSPSPTSPQLPQIARIKSSEHVVASPRSSPTEELEDPAAKLTTESKRDRRISSALPSRLQRAGSISAYSSMNSLNESPSTSPVKSRTSPLPNSKGWENDVESLLRDMYSDIKNHPIYLPGVNTSSTPTLTTPSLSYRSINRRSQISLGSDRSAQVYKRASMRGFLGHPSTDSFRPASPTPSTVTSLSDHTSGGFAGSSSLTTATSIMSPSQTIGFASNLSQSIIKEQRENEETESRDIETSSESGLSTTDGELALMGAPWAKEGLLQRKHYWESSNKRAKDKNWLELFVVISKGDFRMFKFGDITKGASGGATGFGGGNWLKNAQGVGEISLEHSLSCAMPPPGYSSSRRHVFVLTLASGSSFFFQAGTDELVQEWVATCNYWAARLSKEPLAGGVSNMEYGWNKVLPQATEDDGEEELEDMRSVRSGKSQKSLRSTRSGKSRFSSHASSFAHFGGHSSNNPNDRVIIAEWKPPQQPLTGSTLSEDEQLKALQRYARLLQSELETHNELRAPMSRLYSSRSPNASKSTANWEKRSSFLLSEIVKYTTYVSALEDAIKLRSQKTADKAMEKMLKSADEDDEQESLAAVTGRRGLMIHEKFAGSFADVTAPLAHCGDAPIDGIRAQRSSAASLGSFDTEYHETRSLSQSVSDQVSPRASEDISF